MNIVWQKPVIVFYRERLDERERKAFLVIKARRLEIQGNNEHEKLDGAIIDFFPLLSGLRFKVYHPGLYFSDPAEAYFLY